MLAQNLLQKSFGVALKGSRADRAVVPKGNRAERAVAHKMQKGFMVK